MLLALGSFFSAPQSDAAGPADGVPALQGAGHLDSISLEHEWCPEGLLFGHSVCALGDIDGDAVEDFAVGAPVAWTQTGRSGCVLVFSGRELNVLYRLDGATHGAGFGDKLVDVGDLDGDGGHDLAIGTFHGDSTDEGIREVRVVSGRTGTTLHVFTDFSRCLGVLGDLDADGTSDLVLQSDPSVFGPDELPLPLTAVSGRSWEVIRELIPPGGPSVWLVPDSNGDGLGELVIPPVPNSSGDELATLVLPAPRDTLVLRIESGKDGARVETVLPRWRGRGTFWRTNCIAGDLDADEGRELVLNGSNFRTGEGCLFVLDDQTGRLLRTINIETHPLDTRDLIDWLEYQLFVPGDLDGDGRDDLIVARTPAGGETLFALSMGTGERLWERPLGIPYRCVSFDTLADRNGDGVPELLVGATLFHPWGVQYGSGTWGGFVWILSGSNGAVLARLDERRFSDIGLGARARTRRPTGR